MGKGIVAVVSVLALIAAEAALGASSTSPALVVKPGYHQTFTRGELRPGATVRCFDEGHVLSVQAPASPSIGAGAVWAKMGTRRFHLNVDVKPGEGFVVRCGLGGVYWAYSVTK